MCGIIAICGKDNAAQAVLDGLTMLEYRGYDSWGVAATDADNKLHTQKDAGKISAARLPTDFPANRIAIGHTRWATHGGVTAVNAHPHASNASDLTVVMNGIIENYTALRDELQVLGHTFASETDTEVLPHLLAEQLKTSDDLIAAARAVAARCEGRYAFVVLRAAEVVAVRNGCPLILGIGDDGVTFLASDTPAFAQFTRRISYLDDGELVSVSNGVVAISDLSSGKPVNKRVVTLADDDAAVDKAGHAHYMLKEILEQKHTLARAIEQDTAEIERIVEYIKTARGTFFVGCGTAHKVASAGEYFFAEIAGKHVNVKEASEFSLLDRFLNPDSLVVAITQSGETLDVIEALEAAKAKGSKILAIVNAKNSSIERMADFTLHSNADLRAGVASTKATTSQLAVLLLLAHAIADKLDDGRRLLVDTAAEINDLLNPRFEEFVATLAQQFSSADNMFVIGKGSNYPIAREAAIKIQEVSYIHAEGFAGGELKHGPIAMIEPGTPALVLVSDDHTAPEIISNAMEIKARGGVIIGIAPHNNEAFDHWIRVPASGIASPFLNLIPIQIFAYYLALARGHNPDQPRNLAKSVTVK